MEVVKAQVAVFKKAEAEFLKKTPSSDKKSDTEEVDTTPIAKLVEEMKSMPSRVAEHLAESGEPFRRRKFRRFHPMMIEDMMRMTGDSSDPVGILMAASFIKEDVPWLYELAMEVYRAAKSGNPEKIEEEMERLHRFSEFTMRGPLMDELMEAGGGKDIYRFVREFPHMLKHMLQRSLEVRNAPARKKRG
jgi:hypothetical protein